METEIMRTGSAAKLAFLLIPLVLLGACEQQSTSNQSNSARIAYAANVHDKEFDNYIIHINALTTDQLPTEVARGYKISRSKNRVLLNVSVREKQANGETPVTAAVVVIAKNLSSQQKNVKLREIKDTDPVAIYYIGELPVSNEETITFELDVTPAGASKPLLLSYTQQFFTQ
ncbi:MAG TPA: DUF4426 domain-containing protein [Thiotrichaceae bacterium]|jgi:hypothetical protein|nr:DUF4426 domain-containing protein [Thiotrichaceae bacterium]HIM07080.1 DUF4426 domain-containing protein [Gammaproteobacteria bacterium]